MKEILASFVVTFGLPLMMPVLVGASPEINEKQTIVETVENSSSEKTNNTLETKSEINYDIRFIPSETAKQKLKEQKEIILTKVKGEEIKKKEIEDFFPKGMSEEIILKDQYNQLLTLSEIDGMRVDESITFDLLLDSDNNGSEDLKSSENQSGDIQIEQSKAEETEKKENPLEIDSNNVFVTRSIPPLKNAERILPLNTIFNNPVGIGPTLIQDGKALQIGANQKKQKGAIWSKKKINLNKDFKMRSQIYFGADYNNNTRPADGITFTLHNDNRGSTAIGGDGSGLGAYTSGKDLRSGYIKNAISFEFDIFDNLTPGDKMDELLPSHVQSFGHVGFTRPTSANHLGGKQHEQLAALYDGVVQSRWYSFDVDWKAKTQELSIIFDQKLVSEDNKIVEGNKLTYKINNIKNTFGSPYVYWGFTGSTGEHYANSAIAMTAIPNSISHTAKLKHESDTVFVEEIDVKKDEIINIKDTLKVDDTYSKFYPTASIHIDLTGLEYQPGTLYIDNNKVPTDNITEKEGVLTVKLGNLASKMGETANLEMKAKVTTNKTNESKKYRFIFMDDGIISDSNDIQINLKEKPPEITNFSLNSQLKNKSSETGFSDAIEAYKGEEIIIQDIIKAQDDETKFKIGDRIITTLPQLDMNHLKLKINDTLLKTEDYTISGNKTLTITLQDDDLLELLNNNKELILQIETAIENSIMEKQLNYHFDYESKNYKEKSNDVMIHIKEEILRLKEVPETIAFGTHKISSAHKEFWSEVKGDLVVEEFRPENTSRWQLTVKEKLPLTHDLSPNHNLAGKMIWNNQKSKKYITKQELKIEEYKHIGDYKVNATWKSDEKGISVEVPIEKQLKGSYRGELQWQLKNTPQ